MGGEKECRERATRTRPRRLFRRVGSIAASNLSFSFFLWLRRRDLNLAGYPARASEQKRLSIVFAKRRSQSASEQSRASAGDSSRHATRVVGEADSNLSEVERDPRGVGNLPFAVIKVSLRIARVVEGADPYRFVRYLLFWL